MTDTAPARLGPVRLTTAAARRGVLTVAATSAWAGFAGAQTTALTKATPPARDSSGAGVTAFVNVGVVAVDAGRVLPARTVVVRDGRVAAVGPAARVRVPAGARVVDGAGRFLMPGLWDMHVHVLPSADSASLARTFGLFLANGVTGVREMGSDLDTLVAARRRIASTGLLGPRMVAAGPLFDGAKFRWSHAIAWHLTTPEEGRRAVDSVRRAGVDFVKVYSRLPRPVFLAVAAEAKRVGLPFAGHLAAGVTASEASDAGQHSIEHNGLDQIAECVPDAGPRGDSILKTWARDGFGAKYAGELAYRRSRDAARCAAMYARLRRNGTWLVPTAVNEVKDSAALARPGAEYLGGGRGACEGTIAASTAGDSAVRNAAFQAFLDEVRAAHRAGVGLLAGTDVGNPCLVPGFSLHDELGLLVRAGLTPAEALRAATLGPARYLGGADTLGAVAPGKVADLVLLDADPTADVRNARRVAGVVVRGRWLARPALYAMLAAAAPTHSAGVAAPAVPVPGGAIPPPANSTPTQAAAVGPEVVGTAYVNGRWWDGRRFVARPAYVVGGTFAARRPPRVDRTVDLAGAYVTPPFGDAHAHHFDRPGVLERMNAAYLRAGIYYGLSLTNWTDDKARVRAMVNRPETIDVAFADLGVTGPYGHPAMVYEHLARGRYDFDARHLELYRNRQAEGRAYVLVRDSADLDRVWPRVLASGPDLIKVYLLDTEHDAALRRDTTRFGHVGLAPALVPLAVARAHRSGLRVAAHVETSADFRLAVASGVDVVAHLPGYGYDGLGDPAPYLLADADARSAAAHGVVVIPCPLAGSTPPTGPDSARAAAGRRAFLVRQLATLRRAGVLLAVGSDRYTVPPTEEAAFLQRLGVFSNAELLRMWAEVTPRAVFPARRIGRVAPGYEASFLALACDPLGAWACTGEIRRRVKAGRDVAAAAAPAVAPAPPAGSAAAPR